MSAPPEWARPQSLTVSEWKQAVYTAMHGASEMELDATLDGLILAARADGDAAVLTMLRVALEYLETRLCDDPDCACEAQRDLARLRVTLGGQS